MRITASTLALACLALCGHPQAATPAPSAAAAAKPPAAVSATTKSRFNIDTQIAVLMEHPGAKAVMDRHFPKLTENHHYFMLEDMSVRQLAPMSRGKLTEEALAKIDAELAAIP